MKQKTSKCVKIADSSQGLWKETTINTDEEVKRQQTTQNKIVNEGKVDEGRDSLMDEQSVLSGGLNLTRVVEDADK